MKTKLLSVLLCVVLYGTAQQQIPIHERTKRNYIVEQQALRKSDFPHVLQTQPSAPSIEARSASITWQVLCGSMNTYGMVSSNQQPLQYNPQLNALSFIHRKSDTYTSSPLPPSNAESGVIVAEISDDLGATWDSTCIWADPTQFGRYPQGGIYNPSGNTSLNNAYVVGTGVAVDVNDFSGSWYASKPLNTFNNSASTVSGAQQFFSFNLLNYPSNMARHAWSHQGFTVTDDGVVRSLGILGKDLDNTVTMRGYAVATGTFNGNTFDWRIDSIIPNAALKADGSKQLTEGQMVWNPAGTIGYVVGIGVRANVTLSNRSYQPIIYKLDRTTNANATWTLVNQLDFNTTYTVVTSHLPGIPVTYPSANGSVAALPFTNEFDLSIDKNNDLHLGIVFMSGYTDHPDSLEYYTTFASVINPTESYRWQHTPGNRPYIYDFIGNGFSVWKMITIDSISSESPGFQSGTSGYQENPWDVDENGDKLPVDARLQLTRSKDGEMILFSWAESDTLFTNSAFKYNNQPDVKVRAYFLDGNYTHTFCTSFSNVSEKINLSRADNNTRSKATLHYSSPLTIDAVRVNDPNKDIFKAKLPVTLTNSDPFSQGTNNTTWFSMAEMTFELSQPIFDCVGISEEAGEIDAFNYYPNPTSGKMTVKFNLQQNTKTEFTIIDAQGMILSKQIYKCESGENEFELNFEGNKNGIYFLQIKANDRLTTRKIIVN